MDKPVFSYNEVYYATREVGKNPESTSVFSVDDGT